MSLFEDHEICKGCKHANFFDCGKCLKKCDIGAESNRDRCAGSCTSKELKIRERT